MRPATKEERESVDRYIKSIAHRTGIVYMPDGVDYKEDFEIDDIDFFREHPKADMSKVDRIRINGKTYLAADKILEIISEAAEEFEQGYALDTSKYGFACAASLIREKVIALKGGDRE